MSESVRVVCTRERTNSSRSKNDLKDIPIAGPLLGETQGQLVSLRNIQGAISSENIHNALEHIRNYLNHSAVVISQRQMGVQTQISQIDKQLNSLESKIERRLNSVSKFTTELGRLEDANVSSKKMSKSLHDLANKLNEINQTLDDSERLPPFKFS